MLNMKTLKKESCFRKHHFCQLLLGYTNPSQFLVDCLHLHWEIFVVHLLGKILPTLGFMTLRGGVFFFYLGEPVLLSNRCFQK